jgi:hypothetical protein
MRAESDRDRVGPTMRFSLTYPRVIARNYRNVHPETRYARSSDVSIAYQRSSNLQLNNGLRR